jgi:NADH:ubiquinone oxidoreductase subunit 5 (subunit L)/multisubunit Na+/H+ antiporter MnhA subunit
LKLLIAYSTLAQIGYLFLMFPLAFDFASGQIESGGASTGGVLQAVSHATAKAAMFMVAGMIYAALGHDRIQGLAGVARALPISVLAFAVAGVALIGVPPSGASLAKELLLQAAAETRQWWWAVAIQTAGIFTSGYLVLVVVRTLAPSAQPVRVRNSVPHIQEAAALALALCSLLLTLVPWQPYLSVPPSTSPHPPDRAHQSPLADPRRCRARGIVGALATLARARAYREDPRRSDESSPPPRACIQQRD